MSREELLEYVCFTDYTNECSSCDGRYNCEDCKDAINPLLDEYDRQVRADAIEEFFGLLADEITEAEHRIETEDGDTYGLTSNEICGCIERAKEQLKEKRE